MRTAIVTVFLATTACISAPTPPATPPAPQAVYVRAPYDAVWSSTVRFFAESHIPISTIDKASGLIASKEFALSGDLIVRWVNCANRDGSPVKMRAENTDKAMAAGLGRASADFNVFMKSQGDSTLLRVNPYIRVESKAMMGGGWTPSNCVANGAFERDLTEYITANAEASP